MSKADDPALYESGFERIPKDRYWTEPWVTSALLRVMYTTYGSDLDAPGLVWEPAVGRGDIARVLMDHGMDVFASDIDLSEFDAGMCDFTQHDFLLDEFDPAIMGVDKVITNPPYDKAEAFIRRCLGYEDIRFVAMVLRSEFAAASKRVDLFVDQPFAFEIKLTTRPRWDWWFRDKPEASPRHNFSWFCWDRDWADPPTIYWEGKPKKVKKK